MNEYLKRGKQYDYSTISPFLYNFDYFVTFCGINWNNPGEITDKSTCVYNINPDKVAHMIPDLFHGDGYLRIGVHSDKGQVEHFVHQVLPLCEKYHEETGTRFIIYIGGGDRANNPTGERDPGKAIIESPAVARWIVEQNRWTSAFEHPKMLQTPVGICARENYLETGVELRQAIADSRSERGRHLRDTLTDKNDSDSGSGSGSGSGTSVSLELKSVTEHPHAYFRQLQAASETAHSKRWMDRKAKVYMPICTNHTYELREEYMNYGLTQCPFCDVCTSPKSHAELWHEMGQYKYVLSAPGNGQDCGRTYEIMMMGAIPVMPFWTGTTAYAYANMSVILIRHTSDINEGNLQRWEKTFHHGTELYKLTRKYMNKYAFDSSTILIPSWSFVEFHD